MQHDQAQTLLTIVDAHHCHCGMRLHSFRTVTSYGTTRWYVTTQAAHIQMRALSAPDISRVLAGTLPHHDVVYANGRVRGCCSSIPQGKVCTCCGYDLPPAAFRETPATSDGRTHWCLRCIVRTEAETQQAHRRWCDQHVGAPAPSVASMGQ